ncbi:MAG: DUF4881 domain-containing protein [Thermodesulforhabdaceae bacterium]
MKALTGWILTVVAALSLTVSGCNFGKVDEGRTIKYDKERQIVTIIRNVGDEKNPKYEGPPISYKMPADPNERGPEPKEGGRLNLDIARQQITIFNPQSQKIETIPITIVDKKENVDKTDPLVFDTAQGKPKKFPIVDKERKTITIYSSRQKLLVTFSLPEEYFNLPASTWDAGDVVRIYYKEEGKARRFMNVTQTDIYKK